MSQSNANRRRYKVVLKLARLSVPLKIENARHYASMLTGNPNFPTPNPDLSAILSDALLLEESFNETRDGSRSATQVMYDREASLDNKVTSLAHYVEFTANNSLTPESVITSAGMQFREAAEREPRVFSVKHGKVKGTVHAITKAEDGKVSYVWEHRLKGSPDWEPDVVTVKAKHTFSELTSGSTYEFRQRTITSEGESDWTDVAELIVL